MSETAGGGVSASPLHWKGCYEGGWQGDIVAGAFVHPAKMARSLVRRIYDHAFAEGWIHPGDTVVDPFGGIAGTALDAALRGVQWIGCELEPRFSELSNDNINLWQSRFAGLPAWRTPLLMCGDSRKLSEHVAKAMMVVSSPPYAETINSKSNGIDWEKAGRPDRMIPSEKRLSPGVDQGLNYGNTSGQLGAMKEGRAPALIVSSPPYAEIATGAGGLNHLPPKHEGQQGGRSGDSASQDTDSRYGASEGQLARMVVGSPPYEGIRQDGGRIAKEGVGGFGAYTDEPADYWHTQRDQQNLGNNKSGDTFWLAAAEIVEQCRIILQPGGHAIWVTKDFVRNKARVPFSDQWQALCEAHGFRLVCRHQAMLVAHHGEQDDAFGAPKALTTERKSFFRRLAEKKGSPRIDFEDVICMVRI